jgi:endonuclease-3
MSSVCSLTSGKVKRRAYRRAARRYGGSVAAKGLTAKQFKPPSRARVLRIRDRLRAVYGIPTIAPHGHPIAELILTVLSQSTNDRNRDVAYLRLRELGDWRQIRDAPPQAVEEAIRPGGISRVKAPRIQAILRAISDADGSEPSLDWLAGVPLAQAREYLVELPGVGRKTAACVLLFALGLRDVPVDTHVSRVGGRLALLAQRASSEQLHDQMLALTPRGQELELHVNLLRHGRRTCHARVPECERCALARMCPCAFTFGVPAPRGAKATVGVPQPRGSTAKAITA